MGGHREFCYLIAIHLILIFRILHRTLRFTSVVLVVIVGPVGLEPTRLTAPVPHTTIVFTTKRDTYEASSSYISTSKLIVSACSITELIPSEISECLLFVVWTVS